MLPADFATVLPEVILAVYAMGALLFGVYTGKDAMTGSLTWGTAGVFIALAVIALALVLPLWLAALIVAVSMLIVAVVLVLVGLNRVKAATAPDPEGVHASIRKDVDAFKGVGEYEK